MFRPPRPLARSHLGGVAARWRGAEWAAAGAELNGAAAMANEPVPAATLNGGGWGAGVCPTLRVGWGQAREAERDGLLDDVASDAGDAGDDD